MNEHRRGLAEHDKVYKEISILLGTLLGGPVVAGYLIAKNFRALGKHLYIIYTWIFTAVGISVLTGIIIQFPSLSRIFLEILTVASAAVTLLLYFILQRESIDSYIRNGGSAHPASRAIVIGILGMVLSSFLLIFIIVGINISRHR